MAARQMKLGAWWWEAPGVVVLVIWRGRAALCLHLQGHPLGGEEEVGWKGLP